MALHPLELQTYRIVADPTMDASAKQQAIDALWGAPAIAQPSAGPDLRTADVDPSSIMAGSGVLDLPAGPPVSASDAGGMSGMSAAPPPAPPAGPAMSAPSMSPISPEALASAAAVHASSPVPAGPVEAAAPLGMTADDKMNTAVSLLAQNAMRGTPGRVVGAHDQPVSSMVEKGPVIPDDVKEAIHDASIDEKLAAQKQGEVAATNAEVAAKDASREVVAARADETEQKLKDQYAKDHLQRLDTQYETMVKDTAIKPNEWWTHRDTGHKILALIAAGMFGLAGDPNGVSKMVEDDMSRISLERDKQLGAFRQRIEDFKGQMLSPEAGHQAELALGLRAAAAEAKRLAASAAAPEARANAEAQAANLEKQAAMLEAQMAQQEGEHVKTQVAHVPARAIGGPVDPLTVIKRAKEAGLNPEGVLRAVTGGSYEGATPEEGKSRVIFPDHTVGYTSEDLHKETQNELDSLGKLQGNLHRVKALMTGGHTLAGGDKSRLKALIADTTMQLSAMARGEGAQARMAGEMLETLRPLTGSEAMDTIGADSTAKAGIDEALRLYDGHVETIKNRLTPSPKTTPKDGKIETLGKSKGDVGFKAE